jgi:hypothetical protein
MNRGVCVCVCVNKIFDISKSCSDLELTMPDVIKYFSVFGILFVILYMTFVFILAAKIKHFFQSTKYFIEIFNIKV